MSVPLREFQLFQLGILKEFIRLCEKNDLRYFAAYGTLLGAARHQGFIPWDDDIDLWMPAEDYVRFRDVCKAQLKPPYYLQSHETNLQNFISWQRIGREDTTSLLLEMADIHAEWGICIDIFPLFPCKLDDAGKRQAQKTYRTFNRLSGKYLYKHDAKSQTGISKAYHQVMGLCPDTLNKSLWKRTEEKLIAANPGDDGFYDDYCFLEQSWFEKPVSLPFEDVQLPAPAGFDRFLAAYYGNDWSEIPPESKRVAHSGGGCDTVLVLLDSPYKKHLR